MWARVWKGVDGWARRSAELVEGRCLLPKQVEASGTSTTCNKSFGEFLLGRMGSERGESSCDWSQVKNWLLANMHTWAYRPP